MGGGIRTIKDINFLIQNGHNRVIFNTAALENPKFIDQASREFTMYNNLCRYYESK